MIVSDGMATLPTNGCVYTFKNKFCSHEEPLLFSVFFVQYGLNFSLTSSFSPEPGYYEDGSFGIRIENVVLVIPAKPKVGLVTVK